MIGLSQAGLLGRRAGGGDPFWSNVKLLCGFNGTDGATSFTDESSAARVATFVGNAQLDTAQAKYGTASLLLDGTGDYLTFPHSTDLSIRTGASDDWTIESWVRATGSWKAVAVILGKRSGAGISEFSFGINSGIPNFAGLSAGSSVITLNGSSALALDAWHHIALSAVGANYKLFAGGVEIASGTRSAAPTTNTTDLHVGRDPFNSARDWNGWLDEVRVTQAARYTADFTVPSAAFPRG
jgi:hypothetical protein